MTHHHSRNSSSNYAVGGDSFMDDNTNNDLGNTFNSARGYDSSAVAPRWLGVVVFFVAFYVAFACPVIPKLKTEDTTAGSVILILLALATACLSLCVILTQARRFTMAMTLGTTNIVCVLVIVLRPGIRAHNDDDQDVDSMLVLHSMVFTSVLFTVIDLAIVAPPHTNEMSLRFLILNGVVCVFSLIMVFVYHDFEWWSSIFLVIAISFGTVGRTINLLHARRIKASLRTDTDADETNTSFTGMPLFPLNPMALVAARRNSAVTATPSTAEMGGAGVGDGGATAISAVGSGGAVLNGGTAMRENVGFLDHVLCGLNVPFFVVHRPSHMIHYWSSHMERCTSMPSEMVVTRTLEYLLEQLGQMEPDFFVESAMEGTGGADTIDLMLPDATVLPMMSYIVGKTLRCVCAHPCVIAARLVPAPSCVIKTDTSSIVYVNTPFTKMSQCSAMQCLGGHISAYEELLPTPTTVLEVGELSLISYVIAARPNRMVSFDSFVHPTTAQSSGGTFPSHNTNLMASLRGLVEEYRARSPLQAPANDSMICGVDADSPTNNNHVEVASSTNGGATAPAGASPGNGGTGELLDAIETLLKDSMSAAPQNTSILVTTGEKTMNTTTEFLTSPVAQRSFAVPLSTKSMAKETAQPWGQLQSQDTSVLPSIALYTFPDEEFRLGRGAKCQVQIHDPFISSIQFSLTRKLVCEVPEKYTVTLKDASANGTFVNVRMIGKKNRTHIYPGDSITFRLNGTQKFFAGYLFVTLTCAVERPLVTRSNNDNNALDASEIRGVRKPIKWKIGSELLGKGGNAEVFLGMNLGNGKLIAVKRVALDTSDERSMRQFLALQEEVEVLKDVVHPNIVQYLGTDQNETHMHIILEFVPGGSIRHLLDNFGVLSEIVIVKYSVQILEGLKYLHNRRIVHGDLKCANVLVTDKGEVKITDFGTAKVLHVLDAGMVGKVAGTLLWMGPEVFRGGTATPATDMWSFGCCLLEMMSAQAPWFEYDFEDESQIITLLTHTTEPPEIPEGPWSKDLVQLVRDCLNLEPQRRPTSETALWRMQMRNEK
eukprot:PhM_4_TR12772/c0_g2_i1/m.89790